MNKNKKNDLGLLNFEGPVLKLHKSNNDEFVIYDQWDSIVEVMTLKELCSFFDGKTILTDSSGKKWDWSQEHDNAKVSFSKLFKYITD